MAQPGQPKEFDRVILYTDVETDDVIATHLIMNRYKIDNIIVGEGQEAFLRCKAKRMQDATGLESDQILIGSRSGNEFNDKYSKSELPAYRKIISIIDMNRLIKNSLLIVLKPPRELMKCDVSTSTLWMYGSFNFRSIMKTHDHEKIKEWVNSFKRAYIYETYYAAGENNNVNKNVVGDDTMRNICNMPGVSNIMRKWNQYIFEDSLETVLNILISEGLLENGIVTQERIDYEKYSGKIKNERKLRKFQRNLKAMEQIQKNPKQCVFADIGLSLTTMGEDDYRKINITFDEAGYTQAEETGEGNVYIVKNLGIDELVKRLKQVVNTNN